MDMKQKWITGFGALAIAGFLTAPASASILYTDGAINGTKGGWLIDGGHEVSDSFTLSQDSTVTSVDFGLWVWSSELADYSNGTQTLGWLITSGPNTGTLYGASTASLTGTLFSTPPGIKVYAETFSTGSLALAAGTYWLTLQNVTNDSGSVDLYWDENDGPSQAWYGFSGVGNNITPANNPGACTGPGASGDCSESFNINGTATTSAAPEPSAWIPTGSGLLLLASALRRKMRRSEQLQPKLPARQEPAIYNVNRAVDER